MKVTLLSTHCPQCMGAEQQLKRNNIEFDEINSIEEISKLGFQSVPVLRVITDDNETKYYQGLREILIWIKEGR